MKSLNHILVHLKSLLLITLIVPKVLPRQGFLCTCRVAASSISTRRQARVSTMRASTRKGVHSSLSTYRVSTAPDWLRWIPSRHCKVFFRVVGYMLKQHETEKQTKKLQSVWNTKIWKLKGKTLRKNDSRQLSDQYSHPCVNELLGYLMNMNTKLFDV